jgi:hypothetical protein
MPYEIIGLVVAIFLLWQAAPSTAPARSDLTYGTFMQRVEENKVDEIKYD